jgi:hypothetical protein
VPKDAELFEFETYLKDRECKTETLLCPIEKAGTKAALDRCRMLADRIASELREKEPEHFVNILWLAEFQASLECAASVLEQNPDVRRQGESYARVTPHVLNRPAVPSADRSKRETSDQ